MAREREREREREEALMAFLFHWNAVWEVFRVRGGVGYGGWKGRKVCGND